MFERRCVCIFDETTNILSITPYLDALLFKN